jgi:hypothetical protein
MKLIKLLFVSTFMLFAASAFADSHNNAAFVNPSAGECGAFTDTGDFVFTNDTRIVSTQDADTGDTHLKCRFEGPPTVSGSAFVAEGFLCGVISEFYGLLITENTHLRQTPKGDIVLICHAEAF